MSMIGAGLAVVEASERIKGTAERVEDPGMSPLGDLAHCLVYEKAPAPWELDGVRTYVQFVLHGSARRYAHLPRIVDTICARDVPTAKPSREGVQRVKPAPLYCSVLPERRRRFLTYSHANSAAISSKSAPKE